MKTSDILRKAGDISRERGWCQGEMQKGQRLCAFGAIATGSGRGFYGTNPGDEDFSVVFGDGDLWAALNQNDTPGRTHAEVLIALDAAYVLALQEEGADLDEVFK